MLPNQLGNVAQTAANGVSEVLDLKIFRGGMPSDPPNNAITIISLQRSDVPLDPPLRPPVHQPFHISICISTLPTQHTTFT